MSYETLELETKDRIATVTVNRPKALNALNAQTFDDLRAVFAAIAADEKIGAAVLTGAGEKAFVAGADIVELSTCDGAKASAISTSGQAFFTSLETMGKPVVAAINGFALGGGLELALACTFRYASENARLGFPEVKLGVIPGYGGTQRLARLVGTGRALEMILTGEFIDATRAESIGLVNRVVPAAELLPACREIAEKMCAVGPLAVSRAIDAVHRGWDLPLAEGLALEARHFGALFDTADAREGIRAFLEKRAAEFSGS